MNRPVALVDVDPGRPVGQLRVAPIYAGGDLPVAFCFVTSARAHVDPSPHMLYLPDDGLHLDGVGVDEIFYGEHLVELADGTERWCADHRAYQGHSDVIQSIAKTPKNAGGTPPVPMGGLREHTP